MDSYHEALEYLYGLTNYEIKSQFAYAPQFFDLGRVERLLKELGNPHRRFESVHIAGTKGKGSTSVMLASILQAAGYRAGLYTSPHLHSFRERIQVNGALIPEPDFVNLARTLRSLAEKDPELTTFEVATALAFAYFAQAKVEIAIIEVGLGGRLDATNVIRPLVSIITTIGHDHMHILGNTLAEIAFEKAGIIKEGIPVVTAPQERAALAVIQRACKQKKATLHQVAKLWRWRATEWCLDGQEFTLTRRDAEEAAHQSRHRLFVPLLGTHQLRNAAVVLTTVESLRAGGFAAGEQAVSQGLRNVVWPARFEVLGQSPCFVVDGAHNVDSARSLAKSLAHYFPGQKPWYVLAVLRDKDIPAIFRQLLPAAQGVIFSRSHHPRAADPLALMEAAVRYAVPAEITHSIAVSTEKALAYAGPSGLVVAAGSFTTAGEAREKWLRLQGRTLPPLDPIRA